MPAEGRNRKMSKYTLSTLLQQIIKDPSVEVQLAAVRQAGWAIQFIKDPSVKVQLAAIQQNKCAIQY